MTLALVRIKAGCGSERARVVHLTEVGSELLSSPKIRTVHSPEDAVRALCGAYLIPGTFDVLSGMAGMPCEACEINSPDPATPGAIAV